VGGVGDVVITSLGGGGVDLGGNTNLDIVNGTAYDQLTATALEYGGNLDLVFAQRFEAGTFDLFNIGNETGDFGNVTISGAYLGSLTDSGGVWTGMIGEASFSFSTGTGVLTLVPEPGVTAVLAGVAVMGVALLRRRLRRARR
jgi:hypothetical protein